MGTKNIKNFDNNQNGKKLEEKKTFQFKSKDKMLFGIPNPFFQKNEKLSDEECTNFEVYHLKNIKNAFYVAFVSGNKKIKIYKYLNSKKKFEEICKIKAVIPIDSQIKIKYYYNPKNGEEYLFVVKDYNDIEIYLIKSEKKFVYINKKESMENQFLNDLRNSINEIRAIDTIDIIYDSYDNNIYVIISYKIGKEESSISDSDNIDYLVKGIIIYEFDGRSLNEIHTFFLDDKESAIANLIYEDKNLKKFYMIIIDKNIKIIEIKNKYTSDKFDNFFNSEEELKKLNTFLNEKNDDKACIVNSYNNIDCLFIFYRGTLLTKGKLEENKINLIVIDLSDRKIIKNVSMNNEIIINSLTNWNNNYIILTSDKSVYIFDIRVGKIISNYRNLLEENKDIELVKPFVLENKLYGIFVLSNHLEYIFSHEIKFKILTF